MPRPSKSRKQNPSSKSSQPPRGASEQKSTNELCPFPECGRPAEHEGEHKIGRDYVAIAKQYASDVIKGRIPACKQAIQACQRFENDLRRSKGKKFEFVLSDESAEYWCRLLEAFTHVKGKWAKRKERLVLEPWQCFFVVNAFGWVEKAEPTRYRFHKVILIIPRKQGKTFLSAGIGLGKGFADGEYAAEVYFGATSEEQAKRLGFKFARAMALRSPEFCRAFGVKVNTHNLVKEEDGSILKAVIAKPGDGDSPSCFIGDEVHEYLTFELIDTMEQGMAARENPLSVIISSAGSNTSGPCYLIQRDLERILAGKVVNERVFGIIYTINKGMDWKSEDALRMACPNYGISVEPSFLLNQRDSAVASAHKQNAYKRKYLNIWDGASAGWMNMEKWKACADPTLRIEDFESEECIIGLDLASRKDIASKVYLFQRLIDEKRHTYMFAKHYVSELAVQESTNENYKIWAEQGLLTVTPGNITSFGHIKRDLIEDRKRFVIREIPLDMTQAIALITLIQEEPEWDESIEFVETAQNSKTFSPAMKEVEADVFDGCLHYDGDAVFDWMMSNVVCRTNQREDIMPEKEQPENKIDGPVALFMARRRTIVLQPQPTHESEGLMIV
ncbi:MAG TPA: terminase TerL endonuclease subunit [Clostridia bacterium]|nr:terminase TerL endonuclease subunit [Clostridia bacterium]